MKRQSSSRFVYVALGVVVVIGGLVWGLGSGWFGGSEETALRGAPVRRGALSISVNEKGNLKSAQSTTLKSEVEGQTTILWLIEEGKHVEPGDLLCELDTSQLEERRVTQKISVQNADAAFVAARQRVEIQKSQNQSDVSAALRKIEFAEIDVEKYLDGDWPQKLQQADDDILLAEEELKRSRDKLEWSRRLADKGFLTRTELEADELAEKRAELELARAKRQRDLLVEYDFPKEKKSFEAALEEARQEKDRIELRATALLVDYEADMRSNEARLELEREKLNKLVNQIDRAKIKAPVAGMVVYSQGSDGGRWGQSEPIAEGTTVRERQEIITIPATSGMIAEISLHEAVLQKVQTGHPCRITLDALPDRVFPGVVKFKSSLPDQNQWWANPDQRLYRTQVDLKDGTPEMRPGMTCNVEILVEDIPDTLYVPLQAVYLDGGRTVAFVQQGDAFVKRSIDVGKSNHKFAQVLGGVSESDVVALSLPPGAALLPAPEVEEPEGAGDAFERAPAAPRPTGRPDVDADAGGGREGERGGGPPAGARTSPETSGSRGAG